VLESGLHEYPQAGVLHYELARARLLLFDFDGMQQEAEAAVLHAPDNNEFRYFAAMASGYSLIDAAHHGDEDRMEAFGRRILDQLEAILQADPDHHRARYLLVQQGVEMAPEVGLEVKNIEQHVQLLEKKDPVLGAKARCCLVGEKEQKKIWRTVLADHPEECHALVEAAGGLIMAGELDDAEACLDKVIGMDEQECYGLLQLGLAYFMREDWDRALELTHRYLELDPPIALKAYAKGRLGMIHRRMGQGEKGSALMSEAREMDRHVWQTVMPPPREIFMPL